VVAEGQKVKRGDVIARMNEGELGAFVHSSMDGRVARVTAEIIEIEA
jgi:Na+-translocating ferredoxin:NAD+ oxidoreductase RnfC subunit